MTTEMSEVENDKNIFKNEPLINENPNENSNFFSKIKTSKSKSHMIFFLLIIIFLLFLTLIITIVKLVKLSSSSVSNNSEKIPETTPVDKTKYLLIHCAMKIECASLINELKNSSFSPIYNYEIYKGELLSKKVIIAVSGIGPSFTASCLSLLVTKYNIAYILNIGVVGGYGPDIHMGSIIIPEEVINLSSYQTNRTDKGAGIFVENYKLYNFTENGVSDYVVYKTDNDLLDVIKKVEFNKTGVFYGRFGTSEGWNKEYDKLMYHYTFYNTLGEDMEVFSVYLIGETFGIKTLSVKTVSNNEVIEEYFDLIVLENLVDFTKRLIPLINY